MVKAFKNILLACFIISVFALPAISEIYYRWSEPSNIQSLNTIADDFAPSWNRFEQILYFNSDISGYSKFYWTRYIDSTKFTKAELVPGSLNQPGENQSYITFAGEEKAYLSTYRMTEIRPYMNIFHSTKRKKAWSKPILEDSLVFNNFAGHPTISPDGSFMVFATNAQSEHKDTDLWIAYQKDNGSYGSATPINELNTTGNEITPFLASNDTLFFATDGQEGIGGYDVFYSVRKQGVWQKPIPVKEVNTKFDESDFIVLPGGEAIFSSNRPGGKGGLDLYIIFKEKMERKTDEFVPPVELSIASQATSVNVNLDLTYKLMPLMPVYFVSKEANHFLLPNEFALSNIEINLDSLISFGLPVIAKRMIEVPGSVLQITPVFTDSSQIQMIENFSATARKFFNEDWGIKQNRIKIEKSIRDKIFFGHAQSYLLFSSDNPLLFSQLQTGKLTITLDPPVLDLSLNGRPNGMIKKWECNLFINNKFNKVIADGISFPADVSVDLNPSKNEISEADSVRLNLVATDTTNRQTATNMLVSLSHTENKTKEFQKSEDKNYDEYFIFLPESSLAENEIYIKNSIDKMIESSAYSKNIKITYYEKSMFPVAEELKNSVTSKIDDKTIKIELKEEQYKSSLPFSKTLSVRILHIWIERLNIN